MTCLSPVSNEDSRNNPQRGLSSCLFCQGLVPWNDRGPQEHLLCDQQTSSLVQAGELWPVAITSLSALCVRQKDIVSHPGIFTREDNGLFSSQDGITVQKEESVLDYKVGCVCFRQQDPLLKPPTVQSEMRSGDIPLYIPELRSWSWGPLFKIMQIAPGGSRQILPSLTFYTI